MATTNFLQKVSQTLHSNQLLQPNDSILVAVSGGPDSVALLRSLVMLATETGWQIGVVHINHGLRIGASADEAFVVALANEIGLPCYAKKANVRVYQKNQKRSLEEAAREVRHRLLYHTATTQGYRKVALGHHANDNAELILMNFLRGSGPEGLGGMSPQRPLAMDGKGKTPVHLIRPLIHCKREEIDAFLQQHQFPFVLDESNDSLCFRRNRIRHELIPHLQDVYNPNLVDTLNRMANVIGSETKWMSETMASALDNVVLHQSDRRVALSMSAFVNSPIALKRRIVRNALSLVKGNLRKITFTHIEAILKVATKGTETSYLDLPDCIRVSRIKNRLIFSREEMPLRKLSKKRLCKGEPFEYILNAPGTYSLENLNRKITVTVQDALERPSALKAGHKVAFFDMNTVSFPLTLRNVKPGDRFTPLGMTGTQKVNKYFKDRKIPANERTRCPLLLSQGRVIWVMGHRVDDSVKITPNTEQILKVTFWLA